MSAVSSSSQPTQTPDGQFVEETEEQTLTMELLYDDALYLIFEQLPLKELAHCGEVCNRWYTLHSHNYLWRPFLVRDFGPAPCVDSVCRDVYLRCMSYDLWGKKQVLAQTDEKVKAFVRDGFSIIYQTGTERIRKKDLYSDAEVVRIPLQQSVAQMDVARGQLFVVGGNNALSVQFAQTLQDQKVIAEHKAWIKGFDRTDDRIVFYSTNGMITMIDSVGFQKEKEIQLSSNDIDKVLCFDQHLVVSYISTPKLTIYDIHEGEHKEIDIPEAESIATIAHYQGKVLIARLNGEMQLWDERCLSREKSIKTGQMISSIGITKNSLVVGGIDGTVTVWGLPDFCPQGSFDASPHAIAQVVRTADEITVLDNEGQLSTFHLVGKNPVVKAANSEKPNNL